MLLGGAELCKDSASAHRKKLSFLKYYLIYLAIISIITFFTYASDKRKAQKGKWRVREKTLLALSFFGGAIGGYLAMHVKYHKTKHWYFHVVNILGILWQVGLLIWWLLA